MKEVTTVRRKSKRTCYIVCLFLFLIGMLSAQTCFAENTQDVCLHEIVIRDDAGLFSDREIVKLTEVMEKAAVYGNVMLLSVDQNNYMSTRNLSETIYEETFGYSDGVIFVIDMDYRMLWISGFGSFRNIITNDYCDTITDNVYTYASDERYYECGMEAFSQIAAVLAGKNIPMPMKYICNLLISLLIALLANYFIVMSISKKRAASDTDLKQNIIYHCNISNTQAQFTHETRTYNPHTSSSSSGGSSGGGGGGASGGGHSF